MVPSVYVKFHGPFPVNATEIVFAVPSQVVAVPLTTEVGLAFTVNVAVLVCEPQP